MSTTVTYKGSTLTTLSNETKKLNTAGTWLEDDITVTDQGGGSIVITDSLDSHGGTIRSISATSAFYVQSSKTITPSTSAQTVLPDTGYDAFAQVTVEAGSSASTTHVCYIESDQDANAGSTYGEYCCYILYNGTKYYANDSFEFESGDTATLHASGTNNLGGIIYVYDSVVAQYTGNPIVECEYTFIDEDITIRMVSKKSSTQGSEIRVVKKTFSYENQIVMNTIYGTYVNSVARTIGACRFYDCGLTSVSFPNCITIYQSAFYSCQNLKTISFPIATTISSYAFGSCPKLESAIFPSATVVGYSAFRGCLSLSYASFPLATVISSYALGNTPLTSIESSAFASVVTLEQGAFQSCSKLQTVNLPNVTTIGSTAFTTCSSLTSAVFPSATTIGSSAFNSCSCLAYISAPNVTTIWPSAFAYCSSLLSVSFPLAKQIGSYAFTRCSMLSTVIFANNSSESGMIYGYAFYSCYRLLSLYLLASSYYELGNLNVFNSTPISTYTTYTDGVRGSVFVRASLYEWYTSTNINWRSFSARIVSLTDTEVQNVISYGTHIAPT